MAEEWGYIAVKVPNDINDKVSKKVSISDLFDYADLDSSDFDLDVMSVDSVSVISGYLVLEYDCSEWVDFSEKMYQKEGDIQYFAWHGDEYGTKCFYSLNLSEEQIKVSIECEEDEDDIEIKIQLGVWVESLPKELLADRPEFNCLDQDEYISPEDAKTVDRSKPTPQLNVNCYFKPLVGLEELQSILDADFHDFNLESDSGGDDGLFGLLDLFGVKEEKEQKPSEHSVFNWFPISEDRNRTVEELLDQVSKIKREAIYAVNYFGNISFPYKVFKIDESGVNLIFDADDFEEKDLELLTQFKDTVISAKVNWMCLDLKHVCQLDQEVGLKTHVEEQIRLRHKQVAEFQRKDREEHESIWAENSAKVEPSLKGKKYYLYYRKFDSTRIQELGYKLQTYGMRKITVETGLGYSGRNTIVVPEAFTGLAEWLKNNIEELNDHRLVVEEGDDAIFINMN